jgi:uncharacterized membrane protein YhiD involved in acid resistance
MAFGTRRYFLAVAVTLLAVLALMLLSPVDKKLSKDRNAT